MRLGPDLIYGPKPPAPTSKNTIGGTFSTRHKKRNDPIVISAFQEISPDIFQEFVSDDLVSKSLS